ncbi:hypothetical protein SAMN05444143_102286 [Flavobacterium succinicans]|jgi:hypothetical protein|uniref:Uncharacterized protein n=1 Tax=Flavobacterium succinicans TaxID=29536 RepID=A0A1I4TUS9_9FLAO|nr:hypothetical protein SAMN05444143_102286 [Flavobacterium succinicans]
MAKLYSKKKAVIQEMKPKATVVSFLLDYSKALSVVKTATKSYQILKN